MPWFMTPAGRVWVGHHRVLGPVVFDPRDQQALPENRVRLFVVHDRSITLFNKQTAHACIAGSCDEPDLRKAADVYFTERVKGKGGRQGKESRKPVWFPSHHKTKAGFRLQPAQKEIIEETLPKPGICVCCGGTILPERLQAIPGSIRCAKCQTQWEKETGGSPPSVQDLGEVWFPRSEHWRNRGRKRRR